MLNSSGKDFDVFETGITATREYVFYIFRVARGQSFIKANCAVARLAT